MEFLKKIKAIILDMDGVIVDTEPHQMEAFRIWLLQLGLEVDKDFLEGLIGISVEDNIRMIKDQFPTLGIKDVKKVVDERNQIYLDIISKTQLQPTPGIIELIDYCTTYNIRVSLASSSDRDHIDIILKNLNRNPNYKVDFFNSFHSIIAGDDVLNKKPHPEIYQKALSHTIISPWQALAIEDSQAGITSAKSAGLYCLALRTPYTGTDNLQGQDGVLDKMFTLVDLLYTL